MNAQRKMGISILAPSDKVFNVTQRPFPFELVLNCVIHPPRCQA